MIRSKKEYREYVREDRKALGREAVRFPMTLLDWPLRFQLALRRAEYCSNCFRHAWQKPIVAFVRMRHRMLGFKCGYTIPLNVFGKGLNIAHVGTIVVSTSAKVGDYCRLHVCVNIGTSAGRDSAAPRIGDRVYIGPGAKVYGDITIADDIAIGANAVVNRTFQLPGVSIGGIPAKQISDKGSAGLLYIPKS